MGIKKESNLNFYRGATPVFLSLNACMQSNATQGLSIIGMPRTILPHHQPLILFALHLFCWCCSSLQFCEILSQGAVPKLQYIEIFIFPSHAIIPCRRMPLLHAVVACRHRIPSSHAVVACRCHKTVVTCLRCLLSSHAAVACRRRMPSSHAFVACSVNFLVGVPEFEIATSEMS